MKRIFVLLLSATLGVLAGILVTSVKTRRLLERMDYYERKVNRLEQDIMNLRLWMTKEHP